VAARRSAHQRRGMARLGGIALRGGVKITSYARSESGAACGLGRKRELATIAKAASGSAWRIFGGVNGHAAHQRIKEAGGGGYVRRRRAAASHQAYNDRGAYCRAALKTAQSIRRRNR